MSNSLGQLATIHYGKSPNEVLAEDGEYPVVGTGGVYAKATAALYSSAIVVPRKGSLGNPWLVRGPFWPSDTTYAVVPNPGVNLDWLFYNLLKFDLSKLNEATGVPSISRDWLKRIKFVKQDESVQKKITTVIQTIDEAIEQTKALIAKYSLVKAGMMHDLLTRGLTPGGKLRPPREEAPDLYKETPMGWIPKEWEPKWLQSEISILHGYAFEGQYFSDSPPGDVLLVPGNFHRSGGLYFENNTKYFTGPIPKEYVLKNGDLLVVMTDLSPRTLILGRFAILDHSDQVLHNQRIGKVKINLAECWDKDYLHSALNNEELRAKIVLGATGTTVRHTSPAKILNNWVAQPSLDEQTNIVKSVKAIESKISKQIQFLSKLALQKSGLMRDLLTGEVPVKINDPEAAHV